MKTTETLSTENQILNRVGECLYRSEQSSIYYGIFKRDGKQIKLSLKTTDKDLARRRLEELRQKVSKLNTKSGGSLAFPDLADRWLGAVGNLMKPQSRRRRQSAINMLKPHFTSAVRSLDKRRCESWASVRSKGAAARTFNIERETLIQIFDYAIRDGLILDNPARVIKRMKQPKAKLTIPTKTQFKTLVDQIRQLDARASEAADLCELLAYSGCRLGEATAVQWGDVNFELENFTVTGGEVGTKNHEARTVPLFAPLKRHLVAMRDALPQAPQPMDKIFTIASAKKSLATACKISGLPHFTHHSLRHFFCSNAIEAGIDFKVIAGWLGHKDGGVLVARTYGHLRDEHSTMMAKRMTFDAMGTSQPSNVVTMRAIK